MKDWMMEIGIRLPDMVAGFAGGVVNAFVFRRATPMGIIGSVVVGALTANYLGGLAAERLGGGLGTAFVVGLAGMGLCQGLVEAMKRWRPFPTGGGDDR